MSKKREFIGETIGYLTITDEIEHIDENNKRVREFVCYCSACGKTSNKRYGAIRCAEVSASRGGCPSCGCKKYDGFKSHNERTKPDLTGKRFGNLTVVGPGPVITVGKSKKKRRTWECLCDCGKTTFVTTGDLNNNNTKSCGCLLSRGNKDVSIILSNRGINYKTEYTFPDLVSPNGGRLRFDFAVFNNDKLEFLIEYQGAQHFTKRDIRFGKLEREVTDEMKKQYCEKHNIPLFEVFCFEKTERKISDILWFVHEYIVPSQPRNPWWKV